ncbi:zinc-ribbon domain-containing protein, partial [Dysosmobacter sp.]|uniref:zinc-ribbon domain-containing protein n=1 Tax=Dysosmobacter sp. TaxID=2591382 RepID=UPI003AB6A6B8
MHPSLYDFCAGHEQAHLLVQWDDERNAPLTPKDVTYGSHQKVWWRCPQGHSYRSEVRI